MSPRALDRVLPAYRHREVHATVVAASPAVVWEALHATTSGELRLTRLLTRVRGLSQAAGETPFLEAMTQRFTPLIDEPPRALVVGGIGQPWKLRGGDDVAVDPSAGLAGFARPGFVLMGASFEVEHVGPGRTRLLTETRVQPTDAAAARAFRPYWYAIRLGSGLIRRDLLRAVRRRAEAATAPAR
jgi:hypothetical protein